jgi:hypothetical protein
VIDLSRLKKIQGENMKLAKLSLAAIVVAGLATSTFAADTLADAFKNGKVKGEIKAYYFDKDSGTKTADIFTTGLTLGYVTDAYNGLTFGATFQSNYAPFADSDAKTMFAGDEYGSGAVLSEAYLAYGIGKTTVKVGRQFISSPLVSGSGSRMIKESFEGALVVNTDLPATTLIAGYVNKFQGRTSSVSGNGAGDAPSFEKTAVFYGAGTFSFDGAYTVAAINKSIPNLTIVGQYALVQDVAGTVAGDTDVYVGALGYVIPMSNFKIGLDGAYQASSTDADIGLDGDMLGLQVSLIDLSGFGAKVAYTSVSNNDDLVLGMGNGAGGAVAFTAPLISGAGKVATGSTDAYKIELSYDFSKVGVAGLTALGQYVSVAADKSTTVLAPRAADTDLTYWAAEVAYTVPAVKGLSISLQYEDATKEVTGKADVDSSDLRFRANYKF